MGGHAPTPIISALGTLLAEGNRDKPVGIFGSFGWSGEAIDLLETKLKDGGFKSVSYTHLTLPTRIFV